MTGGCLAKPVAVLKPIRGHEIRLDGETDRSGLELAANHLHPIEREHLVRYRLPKRRQEWLAGRLCAKAALASHLDGRREPSRLLIEPDRQGRPRARGWAVYLSISHSRRRAAPSRPISLSGSIPNSMPGSVPRHWGWCLARTRSPARAVGSAARPRGPEPWSGV